MIDSMCTSANRTELESKINYTFKDAGLLETALTHSSYANEQEDGVAESYERLEFLGDAVTGLEVALMIFENGPHLTEGEMTKIRASTVRSESLAEVARSLELGKYMRLGVGADKTDVRENNALLEDAFEALVAAVFLDGGACEARLLIRSLFKETVEKKMSGFKGVDDDYKSRLQNKLQRHGPVEIEYSLLGESGPDHDKSFCVSVASGGKVLGTGEGKTKKCAEKSAAKMALEGLKCI